MHFGLASFFSLGQKAPPPSLVQTTVPYTGPPQFVCPYVRLSLVHNANPQVYGHLSRTRISEGLGWLHISDPPKAHPSYILGPEWRLRLITPPDHYLNTKSYDGTQNNRIKIGRSRKGRSKVPGYSCIPVLDYNNDYDEDEHCLRMKRCGARLVVPDDHSFMEPHDRSVQAGERQIFGWSSAEGVWIYRIPQEPLRLHPADYDDDDAWLQAAATVLERGEPEIQALEKVQWGIRAEKEMEGVCEVLKNAGAMYYENIEECPEVLILGL